ncbi:MAG TPA: acyl-CoA dehydrogenase family protein [Capillimicrobium sp.]|nr:acyl-CoA dehydrogenase family protein [Capillimicrobium sp.]
MSHRSELEEVVDGFLTSHCGPDVVRAAERGGAGALWDAVEELGWTLPTLPEADGGSDASFADACAIIRLAGRHAAPLPLGETALIAAWMLHTAGLPVPRGPMTIAPVRGDESIGARREGERWVLSGRAGAVPWAPEASTIVVLADGPGDERLVAAVPAASVRRADAANLAGEPRADLDVTGVEVAPEAVAPAAAFVDRDAVLARGALVRAVLMLGALERIQDLTVEYAKDRRQFGRPIGRFQAVGHHVAQIARDVALARAAVESAIDATSDDGAPPVVEIAIAKTMCGRAAGSVAKRAHQVHGAIGVTEEYALQLLTRRVWAWRDEFGSEFDWARRLAATATITDAGMWELISSTRPARLDREPVAS